MPGIILRRQYITDAAGNPVGVILPLEECALVEETLKQRLPQQDSPVLGTADKLVQMEQAADDALFMNDLRETMSAFAGADVQWWEPAP